MSSKAVTWGEIIERTKQSKVKNSETDSVSKGEENVENSTDNEIHTIDENNPDDNNLWETNDYGNSLSLTSDLLNPGTGNTIVCQVIPSMSAG